MTDAAANASKTALIVRGGWEGHAPVQATDSFAPFLAAHRYALWFAESPEPYADPDVMASVDLVVQCVTMSTITDEQVAGLRRAVQQGTGLAGWHGGIADSYRASADYLHLVGGQFASHPARDEVPAVRGDPANNFVEYSVAIRPETADHPIVAGLSDFTLTTEQYWVLTDDYIDVLATTTQAARPWDPWQRPVTSPAVWTRRWGSGRVFVATPGHSLDVLAHPTVRTVIERGMLWASR